jgi:hypothetical protein
LLFLAWAGQAYSLLNWDHAVDLGLQNERFTGDAAEQAWALESWGVAVADMIWCVPVGIVALVGILRRRVYGFAAGMLEFSIGVYFPLFFAFQRWDMFPGTVLLALFVFTLPSLIGIAGLLANRRFFE